MSDSDRGRQLRVGYESALNVAFSNQEIGQLVSIERERFAPFPLFLLFSQMLPQLFCSTADLMEDSLEKFGDSIVRSTYMAFVRGDNYTKVIQWDSSRNSL